MRIRDIGQIKGPVLVFGGVYSNWQALQALMQVAQARGIAAGQMINTGDTVAYCADAQRCADAVARSDMHSIAGNVETSLAQGALDCGCGFDAETACDILARGWYAHARAHIDAGARQWMADLPDILTFQHADRRVAVIHGGVRHAADFIWPHDTEARFEAEISALNARVGAVDIILSGHCGMAFHRRVGHVDWVNAGAVGMPPNDGAPQTRYLVLHDADITVEQLSYDHDRAFFAMQQAGLTQGYDRALLSGHWPSEDVLPLSMRRAV